MADTPAFAAVSPLATDLKIGRKGVVNVLLPLPDGTLLVGGSFTSINGVQRNNLAKLNVDGTVALNWGINVNGPVYALGYHAKYLYVGGNFSQAGGVSVTHLFRSSHEGAVDYSWAPALNDSVRAMAIKGDDLYIGGDFTSLNGSSTYSRLARFDLRYGWGALDTTWVNAANGTVRCIAPDSGGIYVGGDFTSISGNSRSRGAYVGDYGWVGSWDPGANGSISALLKTPSGLVVGGHFTQIAGTSTAYLAVLDDLGSRRASFPAPANGPVSALASIGGHVYVGGVATLPQSCFRFGASSPFSHDTGFRPNLDGAVLALAPSGTGLAVGGSFAKAATTFQPGLSRLSLSNAAPLNPTHKGVLARPYVSAFAALPDGGVVAGGFFDLAGETAVTNLAKFSATGAVDAAWQPQPNGEVSSLAVEAGQLYAGGYFSSVGGLSRARIAKIALTGGGVVDATWNPGVSAVPFALHIVDNWLYVGGDFTTLGGLSRSRLGRVALNGTGAADSTWSMDCNGSVRSFASGAGKLYVGGTFSTVKGVTRQALARVNLQDGALDTVWRLTALSRGYVTALCLDDSWLYVGGDYSFWSEESLMVYSLCRVATGTHATHDAGWRPGIVNGASINALVAADGYLYAGGWFSAMGAQLGQNPANTSNLARVHLTGRGAAEPVWPSADATVYDLALSGRRLHVGGLFTDVGGQARSANAVLDLDSPLLTSTVTPFETATGGGALVVRPSGRSPSGSHFRIGPIANGSLFRADGVTPVSDGAYVSVAEAAAGFVFRPLSANMLTGWYQAQEATSATYAGLVGTPATAFIHLDRASQTISFPAIGDCFYPNGSRPLAATASSGGPVTFARISGPVSVTGNLATFTGVGEAVVEARQPGTSTHLPAPSVRQTIHVRGLDYTEWARRAWSETAPASTKDPEADPDGDGAVNLLEFAFDTQPSVIDAPAHRPAVSAEAAGGANRLVLRFTRRTTAARPGISYVAEFASSLEGPWSPQTAVSTAWINPEWEAVTASDPVALPANGARFARVRVLTDNP